VNNALDALGTGGTISISAHSETDCLVATVRDDGSGIHPEDLDRIFQPFFTTKPVGRGTGLGLAVVYGIVRGWGGEIKVESDPDHGTAFFIRIPLAEGKQREGFGSRNR